jgi:TRAF3-interacting protein 1
MGDFWKTTSDLFSGFIEKPKMTEKLLQKPPFKYLFDIISETTKKSGWGNGNGLCNCRFISRPIAECGLSR